MIDTTVYPDNESIVQLYPKSISSTQFVGLSLLLFSLNSNQNLE